MSSSVRTERRGRVLEIVLDRPKANAINAATSKELGEAFRTLDEDVSLSVAIITGSGDRFFSAGWDLKAAAEGESPDADQGIGGFAGLTEYWGLKKPVIAAVNGLALGGGFELALAADLIVAASHAKFGLTEAAIGLIADAGGVIRLPRLLPRPIAMEMLFTGRQVTAHMLKSWGLANEVVPGGQLMSAARELADRIAASAPLSLQAIKEIDRATEGHGEREAYRIMREADLPVYRRVYGSEDAAEGMAALSEKRAPNWKGR
ncbi:enoyl-CoA hydratase-related protein [Mesorhizobium sp.]|uniref:enoyl-CoA hydratase-related protein n=1 Tax=Mesorhizobium sp. TaxID=1871066 RepID=UPI000FE2DE0F|nr:enoyl-CoA hydratase-related protein [Mesorhizobium sp.]RWN50277.1 MAG: crotonobetainyl-CoA hydratase [Mesorhizobium sp.]RWN70695.1 MAG: crotonobetainyl-CoA hydratase [Mesorhizobium sp.]RWN71323.1 MAG: crotonobetainyl-CoA hydratase [Mesorhizobium sp.]RWN82290.1 MAG: crotonobetainyl-CoA hydratase [Mesorhizobium sp.]RWO06738.1 MAG: crotonobetainyl-CoA hydratase [Mesorhizobium sp.]